MKKRLIALLFTLIAIAAAGVLGWGALRASKAVVTTSSGAEVPTTRVKRGRVTITVAARGELQGGNSEVLTAPMSGGGDMAITSLRAPGKSVRAGDGVAQFDTTQQDFNLREAEADLAEAEQQVIKAQADLDST